MRFSLAELVETFDAPTLQRGRQYWQQHRVVAFDLKDTGAATEIEARVQGTEKTPYVCSITSSEKRGAVSLGSTCTCPVGSACKHVAAATFEALNRWQRGDVAVRSPPVRSQSLPEELETWLEKIEAAQRGPAAASGERKRLVFVLHPIPRTQRLRVQLATVKTGKAGEEPISDAEEYYAADAALRTRPKFMGEDDLELLRALYPYRIGQSPNEYELRGDTAALLRRLLATGRLWWQHGEQPLSEGAPRAAAAHWLGQEDGSQQLTLEALPPVTGVLALSPPWYLDASTASVGPLETSLAPALAALVVDAPRLPLAAIKPMGERLAKIAPADLIPTPQDRKLRTVRDTKPVPVLTLYGRERKTQYFNAPRTPLAAAHLSFEYRHQRIAAQAPEVWITHAEGEEVVQMARDHATERKAVARLTAAAPFKHAGRELQVWETEGIAPQDFVLTGPEPEAAWMEFVLHQLPGLQDDGWKIEYELSFPHRYTEVEEWIGGLEADARNQWFDVELGIQIEGQPVNLLPLLVQVLRSHPQELTQERLREAGEGALLPLQLPDGRRVAIPLARVRHILETLVELYDGEPLDAEGKLRLSRLDALRLIELQKANDAAQLRWRGDDQLLELGERLKDFSGVGRVTLPKGLNAQLRDYQHEGVSWLQFLREYGLGGILADDMGLGKTIQTLTHILIEKEQGRLTKPALVVAPTSLVGNWVREANLFAPELRVLPLHGQGRKQQFERIGDHDLVVTTYPLLPRDKAVLTQEEFHILVLDEAQNIKNAKSLAAQMVQQIPSTHRLCLTGTPMENHLGELWSQFHFLQPGMLGDANQFKRIYRTPIEKNADEDRRAHLVRRVSPFILRRTKAQVVKELPPKTEIIRTVALEGAQRDLYETVRLAMNDRVRDEIRQKGVERSHIMILDALLKLRQVCCDPRLVKMEAARRADNSSAKLELLFDVLPEMLEEGRKVLLFSQFTSMLELIEQELNGRGIRYLKLTGETQNRQSLVDAFQRGDAPLFLISLKAGGVGLNLTAADTVIHYDPWWNPAVENQATDRAYRIGQDKPVFVYKLVCEGSVEEKIQALQQRKAQLAAAILGAGTEAVPMFGPEDLKVLFEPLA